MCYSPRAPPSASPENCAIRTRPLCRNGLVQLLLQLGLILALATPGLGVTRQALGQRLVADGLTTEWEADESLFQLNDEDPTNPVPEESISDSEWGFNNDLNQIRITWDADFLYVGVNAIIWGNNVIVLLDYKSGGMDEMTSLSAWRRNFVFQGFRPDFFLATWDGNTLPQAWEVTGDNVVTQKDAALFQTVATFSQGTQNRALEAAVPWSFLLGEMAAKEFSTAYNDSVYVMPAGFGPLRIVGVVTAGADGTGGPDSAPDNLQGHVIDGSQQVTVDNHVTIPLDLYGPGGTGGPDGVVDFGANIRDRVEFRVRPPIVGIRQEIQGIRFNAPVISPEQGGQLEFEVSLSPEISVDEDFRTVSMTAEVLGLDGSKVRTLYHNSIRSASTPRDPSLDEWDCRDDGGSLVDGGIYLLRLVLEPDSQRKVKAFSVVR